MLFTSYLGSTVCPQNTAGGLSEERTPPSAKGPLELPEAVSLKERMALYQAAVSKVEINNAVANVSGLHDFHLIKL